MKGLAIANVTSSLTEEKNPVWDTACCKNEIGVQDEMFWQHLTYKDDKGKVFCNIVVGLYHSVHQKVLEVMEI
jgi:hypothetical protein